MVRAGLSRATRQYFMTTTLHGFKYLCSGFNSDRICWLSWCVASACCAGALCAVLWARFQQVPALLVLRSAAAAPAPLPVVAVCLPPRTVARVLIKQLSQDEDVIRRLSLTIFYIIQGKKTKIENTVLLENLLASRNETLLDALYSNMPPCHEMVKKCRWQGTMVPCEELFHRELSLFGVCCTMHPVKLKSYKAEPMFHSSEQLGLVLHCTGSSFFSCRFFTKYEAQETVNPLTLLPGSEYKALLRFTSVQVSGSDELMKGSCVSSESYSKRICMVTCMERFCGCSNPLRTIIEDEANVLPRCRLSQIYCLQEIDNSSCHCLPACTNIVRELALEDSPMESVSYTLDPLYSGLNVSTATVVKLSVNEAGSKIFARQPTETWFTLLSSLGGVFNMFLGVGLFSALEILFFILVRVPAAMRTFPEMEVPVTHVQSRH